MPATGKRGGFSERRHNEENPSPKGYKKGNLWLVRYYDNQVLPDGTIQRLQRAHKLVEAVGEYRSKRAARVLADEFLAPLNDGRSTPQSTMTLTQFVENIYLPFVQAHKRISTFHGYRNMWKAYLKPHGEIALRDFRTADGEQVLDAIADRAHMCRRSDRLCLGDSTAPALHHHGTTGCHKCGH